MDNESNQPVKSTIATRRASKQERTRYDLNQNDGSDPQVAASESPVYTVREIVKILQKAEPSRTKEEADALTSWAFLIPEAQAKIKATQARKVLKQRTMEQEEPIESIEQKSGQLARLIQEYKNIVVYTGAGISTSASIPDYRGPNGLWTQIKQKGHFSLAKNSDLSAAEPTLTHMAIKELCRRRIIRHVVSQNCDGLHIRSGIPKNHLSELHGNMFLEACQNCEKQYYREADVTSKTSRFRHKTGRKCHDCPEPDNNLKDTIVLFGERNRTKQPMNWEQASKAAERAELIICLGSSLKVLTRYHCLWPKSIKRQAGENEPKTKLVIINLQYTPKDDCAYLKITGKCDIVMSLVMQRLNIEVPKYYWYQDPLMTLSTPFTEEEKLNLKQNLIFENKLSISNGRRPMSTSPSLFVSEITTSDDKRLKMRIRVMNTEDCTTNVMCKTEPEFDGEADLVDTGGTGDSSDPRDNQNIKFALPGWLGKSLGNRKTSSYKRKRHGNKGKKLLKNKVTE